MARALGDGEAMWWHSELGAPTVHARESNREGENASARVKQAAWLLLKRTPTRYNKGLMSASGGHAAARCCPRSATTRRDAAAIRAQS